MTWQVRHQGSPRSIDGLSLEQVHEGLAEGLWEPTDEVRGPGDADWQPLESHPATAEAAAEVEPPPPAEHPDETHLDFNALIDVCLVLLIFFILTTTVAAFSARLDMPDFTGDKADGPVAVTEKEVNDVMIVVAIKMEGGRPVTRIEGKEVGPEQLYPELKKAFGASGKKLLLLDHDRQVPHGAVVAVQDAAKLIGVEKVLLLVPDEELKK
jgi:biopolymer transport protein ExbD